MNPLANLSIYCVIAFALLGSMIFMLLNVDKNDKNMYFLSLLKPEQQEIYKKRSAKHKRIEVITIRNN